MDKCKYIIESTRNLQNISSLEMEGGYIFKNPSFLDNWACLLDAWIDQIKMFCVFCVEINDNPPYIDNEMGNVGLVMSAAWKVGGIALCEKIVEKNKDVKTRKGRLDLWMKLPGNPIQYLVEAKHTYHLKKEKSDKSPDKYDYVELKKKVITEAGSLTINPNQCAVAIVFLTHNVEKYRKDYPTEDIIRFLLNEENHPHVYKDWDLVAWCFPRQMRNDIFPGVILSAKCIPQSK